MRFSSKMNPKIKFSKTKAIHLTFKPVIAIKIPQNEFMNKIINLKQNLNKNRTEI